MILTRIRQPDSNRVDAIVVDGRGGVLFLSGPLDGMSNLPGINGGGQTDGRTHPLGGVLVHVLSIVRVPQDF